MSEAGPFHFAIAFRPAAEIVIHTTNIFLLPAGVSWSVTKAWPGVSQSAIRITHAR
jgi:hypothetical protein